VVTGSLFLVAEILAFYEGVQSDGVKLNEGRL
jgi:hypothetical protein